MPNKNDRFEEHEEYERPSRHERFVFDGNCPAHASERIRITVPVTVRADADVGDVKFRCKGVVITRNSDETPGEPGAVSKFTISQRMRVDIPIVFRAECDVGEEHVKFGRHENDECENDRDEDDLAEDDLAEDEN